MQSGVSNIVLTDGGGYRTDIADMLDHGRQGQRHDGEYCAQEHAGVNIHIEQVEYAVFPHDGQADNLGLRDLFRNSSAGGGVYEHGDEVGAEHAEEDGDDLGHALAPDVEADDDDDGRCGYDPVFVAVVDSRGGQDKADGNDDGACDYRGEELHDLFYAECLEQRRQDDIHKSCAGDAEACVNEEVVIIYGVTGCVCTDGADRIVAADEGKGRAEKCGNLALCQHVEQQSAEAGKQQRRCDIKSRKERNENGCAEHCEHVLKSENQHSGSAKGACVVHGSINHGFFFH